MRPVVLSGLTFLAIASAALGGMSAFTLPAETIIAPGTSARITVSVDGEGLADAMSLFAQVTGPFTLTGVELIGGTVWDPNYYWPVVDFYDSQSIHASLMTRTGTIPLEAGAILAYLTVTCDPATPPTAAGTISTQVGDNLSYLGYWNPEMGQATGLLFAPEPTTALLLLAGLATLLRRR